MKINIYILFLWFGLPVFAQQKLSEKEKVLQKHFQKGIRYYDQADYDQAEVQFRKALSEDPVNAISANDLGLSLVEQQKGKEAVRYFQKSAENAVNKSVKNQAYFNQGNVWYEKKQYEKAIESYKNALRNNPGDEEARYNLALAMKKLKQQQKKNKNNKKNNKQNKDQKNKDKQNKDKQNKDQKNKDQKNKKDKKGDKKKNQNKNKDKKDGKNQKDKKNKKDEKGDKQKKRQPKQGEGQKRKVKLSPQQVKQLLVALKNKEQKTQKKIKAKILKGKSKRKKQEKDW